MREGQIYKHCKGHMYKIVALARDSSNCLQKIVVYQSLEDSDYPKGTIWIRTKEEFTNNHRTGMKRFVLQEDK